MQFCRSASLGGDPEALPSSSSGLLDDSETVISDTEFTSFLSLSDDDELTICATLPSSDFMNRTTMSPSSSSPIPSISLSSSSSKFRLMIVGPSSESSPLSPFPRIESMSASSSSDAGEVLLKMSESPPFNRSERLPIKTLLIGLSDPSTFPPPKPSKPPNPCNPSRPSKPSREDFFSFFSDFSPYPFPERPSCPGIPRTPSTLLGPSSSLRPLSLSLLEDFLPRPPLPASAALAASVSACQDAW
mmetsp:Transcript_1493/g.3169  ORF Transcript_1493/g.3169 Transcript_1493/m.3169 type:complete len:245 (+) Transcript_1493:580-1314(+)